MHQRRPAGSDTPSPGSFWVWATCLILGVVVLGGAALAVGWDEYREHRRGAERVHAYGLAVTLTARLTDERDPLIELLAGADRPGDLTEEGRARQRARSDEALARLDDVLSEPRYPPGDVGALRAARDALASLRGDVDALAAVPPSRRDPEAVGDAISRLSAVLEGVTGATRTMRGARPEDPAMAMDDIATADLAARVRDRGGRMLAQTLTTQGAGGGPAAWALDDAGASGHARLAGYVRSIDTRVDPAVDDPRVNTAWERLAAAAAEGLGAGPGGIDGSRGADPDELVELIAAAESLRDVSLQVGAERAEHHRDGARRWLVALSGLLSAALVAAGIAIVVVRRRVVTPLLLARRQIIALADGDLPDAVDAPRGDQAVEALFDAVEVLRRSQERRFALERERATLSDQLRVQAETDALTGLLNRHALESVARDLVADGAGEPGVGLIMCDLDRFKAINDRHGHLAGDAVLREVAARLRGVCDPDDLIARFGGEEFVVLVRGGRLDDVAALAEDLRIAVADTPVSNGDGTAIDVTASFGVVAGRRDDGWEALVASADAALYEAKQTGRNRVVARRHGADSSVVDWSLERRT